MTKPLSHHTLPALAILFASSWLVSAAWSQASPAAPPVTTITVNPAAPAQQQAQITSTASGVTQINIPTPVGGVSHGRYTQFDVGNPGLILNNSVGHSNTQIGGWVAGNPNLAAGSASIILNEVNSSQASQLRGPVEVAGQRAEVIIANPSGIVVNGGAFLNASGATLTTGTPQFNGGSLSGFQVGGGTIAVTGNGLDTISVPITTLQAQKIMLQGGVFAQDLRAIADNTGGTPDAVVIDVAAIGSMYANKITIRATGRGAGVNNAGLLQANGGTFSLSADGTLSNSGAIYGNSVAIAATTLNNVAANPTDPAPVIAARERTGRVDIGVQTLNNQEGALIYSEGDLGIGGSLDANGQATGRATSVINNSATIEAAGNLAIRTQTLANTYSSLRYRVEVDPTTPATSGSEECGVDCWHSWTDTYYRAVPIPGPNGPAVIRAGGNIDQDASISALNSSSQILAGGTLTSTGAALVNQGIDLSDEVATRRDHLVTQTYMENGIDCPLFCRSERRWRYTTSTDLIARDQTIGPALAQARSSSPSTTVLPNSALFTPSSNVHYLIETRPAFTNLHIWLSSDYMLQALSVDPDITQKRLGDGFYEQRLINEQVARLTGYRRLADYSSDEQQYQALMNAGITLAQALQLRVGIALSAAQVARLTSDIVWLVQEEVTLPDGSTQKVLVPQVYAMARSGDLQADGALLSGQVVQVDASGDIDNLHGTIQGRELLSLNATNVRNLAGRLQGQAVDIQARQNIDNIGGAVIAGQSLQAQAGRDLRVETTTKDSQPAQPGARAPIAPGDTSADTSAFSAALLGRTTGTDNSAGLYTRSTDIQRIAGLYVTEEAGVLLAQAGNKLTLTGAALQSAGSTTVDAGNTLTLNTVTTSASLDATMDAGNYNRTSRSTEVGSALQSAGNTTLSAGQDVKARAADVQAAGNLNVSAGNNVVVEAGQASSAQASARTTRNSAALSSSTRTERSTASSTQAVASNLGGRNVTIIGEQNIGVTASNVVADKDLRLAATRNLTIAAGTNTQTQSSYSALSESGVMSGGDLGVSVGSREQTTDQKNTRTTAAASTVGSTGGNVAITAGQTYTQTGSDVLATDTSTGNGINAATSARQAVGAPASTGNIAINAQKVDIVEARETSASQTKTEFKQSGITLSLSNPVVSAAQTIQKMDAAAQNTKSARMKALAAGSAGLAGYGAGKDVGAFMSGQPSKAADLELNISVGASSSQSTSTTTSDTARGSAVMAGNNTTIRATGDAATSDLTVRGSTVQSGDSTTLQADHQVQLLAAANTSTQTSDQKSSSASVGVTLGKNKFGVTVSAAQGSGDGNGQDTSYTNTHIEGRNTVNIQSGGNTTLQGAVVKADTVNADVGGKLQIESLQDSSRYKESSQNASGSVTVGYGAGGSVSVGATRINSDYQSVTEQSAIRAGDGGFNVQVQGDTELKGGAITSTQAAIDNNKNSFSTAKLSTSDIENKAYFEAESYQVTVGTNGGSAGVGQDSGSAQSTTRAGISGMAGNTAARTGDAETGIAKIFDQAAVSKEVNAQVAITQEFGKQAPKAVADYAKAQFDALTEAGQPEEAAKWAEGGRYRVLVHATLGALSGGAAGAAGAATVAGAAPVMNRIQDQLAATLEEAGLSKEAAAGTAKIIAQTTALAVGTAVGGVQGGSLALNVDANNRQLHPDEVKWIKKNAAALAKQMSAKLERNVTEQEAQFWLTKAGEADVDNDMQRTNAMFVKGINIGEDSLAFNEAKIYILDNTKRANTFVDDKGQIQTLFTAKSGDFYKPEVYSQYRNDAQYRDFYWETAGVNLKGDNMTPQEKLIYEQRQAAVDAQTAKELAVLAITGGLTYGAARYKYGAPGSPDASSKKTTSTNGKPPSTGKPDEMLPDSELLTNKPSGQVEWAPGANGVPRVFVSNDPIVGKTATTIEQVLPGAVKDVNVPIKNPGIGLSSDADIMLKNGDVIEVKSGGGTGATTQVANQTKIIGDSGEVIVYGPNLKPSVVKGIESSGTKVFKNLDELMSYIKSKGL